MILGILSSQNVIIVRRKVLFFILDVRDINQYTLVERDSFLFELSLNGLHLRVGLVVFDPQALSLLVQSFAKEAQVEGEGRHEDVVVIFGILQVCVGVKLADQFVLVEVVHIKGDLHQALRVEVNQLFDQFNVAFEVLRILKLWHLANNFLGDGALKSATDGRS